LIAAPAASARLFHTTASTSPGRLGSWRCHRVPRLRDARGGTERGGPVQGRCRVVHLLGFVQRAKSYLATKERKEHKRTEHSGAFLSLRSLRSFAAMNSDTSSLIRSDSNSPATIYLSPLHSPPPSKFTRIALIPLKRTSPPQSPLNFPVSGLSLRPLCRLRSAVLGCSPWGSAFRSPRSHDSLGLATIHPRAFSPPAAFTRNTPILP